MSILHLVQAEEDSEVLVCDTVFQIHKMVSSRSAFLDATLRFQYDTPTVEDPHNLTVYHLLHGLGNTTS